MSSFELSVLFFLQLAFILTVCRIVGWLAKWAGQPQGVAEMIAGVIMGPSLLGWLFPAVQAWLFPTDVKGLLFAVSQVGLVLYMFLVGLEFDTNLIRNRLRSAVGVSLSGILAPFGLGCILGYFLIRSDGFFFRRSGNVGSDVLCRRLHGNYGIHHVGAHYLRARAVRHFVGNPGLGRRFN